MVDVPPELAEVCQRARVKYPVLRHVNTQFYTQALKDAEEYHGCYITYFRTKLMATVCVYRVDRLPTDDEIIPIIQELFEDGEIHEVANSYNRREFIEELGKGSGLYVIDSVSEQMGKALADRADKKDEVELFDLDKTELARRYARSIRNGSN